MAQVLKTFSSKRKAGRASPMCEDQALGQEVGATGGKGRLAQAGGVRTQRRRASARRLEAIFAEADGVQTESAPPPSHRRGAR